MAGRVYRAATGDRELDRLLDEEFALAEAARDADDDTGRMRGLLAGHAMRVQEAPGKEQRVFVSTLFRLQHGTPVAVYVADVKLEGSEDGYHCMGCAPWPAFKWPGGRVRPLSLDGTVPPCMGDLDGCASRFNHTCGRPNVAGRWKTYGRIKVLEFKVLCCSEGLEAGTELVFNYDDHMRNGGFTVSREESEALEACGVSTVECRCAGGERCPRDRFVPAARA